MSLLQLLDKTEYLINKFAITTEAHASGKVLITGGYLVLLPKYRGISIALNCKFCTSITVHKDPNTIIIKCPQWIQKELRYHLSSNYQIKPSEDQLTNVFIQNSLQCFITFLYETKPSQLLLFETFGVEISLYGDEAFYNKNHMIGLGSSAALTVSFIKCLFKLFDLNTNDLDLHNLCQLSHFISQNKIGSGFDIATSLFGSIIFRRSTLTIDKAQFKRNVDKYSKTKINIKNVLNCMKMSRLTSIALPPHLSVVMAVPINSFGSKTPHMVTSLFEWKTNNETHCEILWNQLNECNECIIQIFETLTMEYDKNGDRYYMQQIEQFCACNSDTNDDDIISNELRKLRCALKKTREYQKKMSRLSQVNIVPDVMDQMLNEIASINGVIEGGLPGAGGFDAIYFICVKDLIPTNKLQSMCYALNLQILDV